MTTPEYHKANKVKNNAASRAWYHANKEKARASTKAWFAAHPEYNKIYSKKRYDKKPQEFLFYNCRNRAKKKDIPFSITVDDIVIPEVCPVLGIPIRVSARGFHPNSPSIDRFIPELGYVPTNIRVISNRANLLKRDATLDELKKIVAYMEQIK